MTPDPTHQYSRLDELVAKGDALTEPEWIEFDHLAHLLADAGYQAHRRTLPGWARSPHHPSAHDAFLK